MSSPMIPLGLDKIVRELFATSLIGFVVATMIYGITVLQGYIYFRNKSKDHPFLKVMIAGLLVLDTLSTLSVAHSLYTYTIVNFENVLEDLMIPWSFLLENTLGAIISIVVQSYYANQLWRFSHNIVLVAAIGLFAAASFGLNVWATTHEFITPILPFLAARDVLVIGGLIQGHGAACDILITAGLCYYLYRARTGIRTTQNIINSLMIYSVNRGALITVCQIMFLVLFVALPSRTIWLPFHQVMVKLYVNSLLAIMNARDSLNGHSSDCYGFKTFHVSRLENNSDEAEQMAQQLGHNSVSRVEDGRTHEPVHFGCWEDPPMPLDLRSPV